MGIGPRYYTPEAQTPPLTCENDACSPNNQETPARAGPGEQRSGVPAPELGEPTPSRRSPAGSARAGSLRLGRSTPAARSSLAGVRSRRGRDVRPPPLSLIHI